MPPFPDRQTLTSWSEPGIWERGEALYRKKAVVRLAHVGSRVYARVQGERLYVLGLDLDNLPGVARCSCPASGKPWCKHLVALACALEADMPDTEGWGPDELDSTVEVTRTSIWLSEQAFTLDIIQQKIDLAASEYHWLDALAWWLAWQEAARLIKADWPLPVLPDWPEHMVVHLQKALLELIFDRFQAMESYWEGRPSRAHMRYDWQALRPAVNSLATEFVSRHFAEIRALALGLSL